VFCAPSLRFMHVCSLPLTLLVCMCAGVCVFACVRVFMCVCDWDLSSRAEFHSRPCSDYIYIYVYIVMYIYSKLSFIYKEIYTINIHIPI